MIQKIVKKFSSGNAKIYEISNYIKKKGGSNIVLMILAEFAIILERAQSEISIRG